MTAINHGLQKSMRSFTKEGVADLIKGNQKSGKEMVRATHEKFINKTISRRSAMIQQFISEKGRGGKVDFTI